MARLLRYAWPSLAMAWLIAFATAGAGPSVGVAVLPTAVLFAAAVAALSTVDSFAPVALAGRFRMAVRSRAVTVLRSSDPDAAGRPRPRAPGA
jgi:hypothetical protein